MEMEPIKMAKKRERTVKEEEEEKKSPAKKKKESGLSAGQNLEDAILAICSRKPQVPSFFVKNYYIGENLVYFH
jgi:hypothetical protein